MPMKIPTHKPFNTEQARQRQENRLRVRNYGTNAARGYNALHRKVRAAWLMAHPLCEWCCAKGIKRPATELDHRDGDAFNIANSNLRSGCKSCHASHTNATRHLKPGTR